MVGTWPRGGTIATGQTLGRSRGGEKGRLWLFLSVRGAQHMFDFFFVRIPCAVLFEDHL